MLDRFRGRITQRVPLTSAVKVDGEPLYKKAHRGETAETPEREVMVYDLSLIGFDEVTQRARLLALVGSGTYARTLAADIGEALECGGYARSLRRTRVGMFSVDDALSPDELSPQRYEEGGPRGAQSRPGLGVHPQPPIERGARSVWRRTATNCGMCLPGAFASTAAAVCSESTKATGDRARPLVVFPGAA